MLCMTVPDCTVRLQGQACNISNSTCHTSASLPARAARLPVRLPIPCISHRSARRLQQSQHSTVRVRSENVRVTTMSAGESSKRSDGERCLTLKAAGCFRSCKRDPALQHAETIDGKGTAATIRQEIAAEVAELKEKTGKVGPQHIQFCHACAGVSQDASMTCMRSLCSVQVPGLAVILVGSRKDSETYVRSKKKACAEVGITDFGTDLPEDASEEDVLAVRLHKMITTRTS